MIKVYLDDERPAPDGWVRVTTPAQAIALLETGEVSHLSLDHDLGDDEGIGTGYDVVLWMEEQVFLTERGNWGNYYNAPKRLGQNITTRFIPPEYITVHTANVSARVKMEQGIQAIVKMIAATMFEQARRGHHHDCKG
jgi:hypothetical protein